MCSGQVALRARTYRGFHSVKQQEVLLLPSGYSQGRKVVTFTGEELLFSGGKSCHPWGEELLPSGAKSYYLQGEELLPSRGGVVTLRRGRVVTLGGKSSFNSNIFFFPYQPLGLELQLPYFYTL